MRAGLTFIAAICLSASATFAQTATATPDCAGFLHDAFFGSTPVARLRNCITSADIDARDTTGRTALHIAVSVTDNPAIVRSLLLQGWDLALRDAENRTPLHRAAEFALDAGIISDLIAYGAAVDERVDPAKNYLFQTTGITPLFIAALRPEAWEIMSALIAAGADVNALATDQRRPLHAAAIADQDGWSTRLLLRSGAAPDAEDSTGTTALQLAAEKNAFPIITQLLLTAGASADAQNDLGQTPLQMAAAFGQSEDVFSLLFMAALTPCLEDSAGRTALSNAQQNPVLMGGNTYWKLHQFCATAN